MTDKRDAAEDLWVFAYGSLIWNPGFEPAEARPAILEDFHRSFAMRSLHYRGTEAAPGLVLALDFEEGAECRGLALRVAPERACEVMAQLRERELISSAYLEKRVVLRSEEGEVPAVCFVIDREHAQYCGGLPLDVQAGIIARAAGERGPNDEYLHRTVEALRKMDIEDADLEWLDAEVRRLSA